MRIIGKLDGLELLGFILVLCIVFSIINGITLLTSFLIGCTFIYTAVLYIWKLTNHKFVSSQNHLIVFSVVIVLINITISGFGDFNYYKKAIMYICTLLLLVYNSNTKVSFRSVWCIILLNVLIGLLYVLSYKQGFDLYDGEMLLTFNFSNPNQTGLFVFTTFLYILLPAIYILESPQLLKKILVLALLVPLSIFLYKILTLTGCRSAIMAVFVFGFLTIYDYLRRGKKWMKKWMIALITVLPFVFVFFYISWAPLITFDVSFGIENSGKSAITRLSIWEPIVNNFFHYFMFGDYYGISNGTGVSQMHNTHLDVYASYGLLTLILFIVLLRKILWKTYVNTSTRFQRLALYAFISSMVIGTFEASYVAGSGGLFILTNGFILLANCNLDEGPTGKLRL